MKLWNQPGGICVCTTNKSYCVECTPHVIIDHSSRVPMSILEIINAVLVRDLGKLDVCGLEALHTDIVVSGKLCWFSMYRRLHFWMFSIDMMTSTNHLLKLVNNTCCCFTDSVGQALQVTPASNMFAGSIAAQTWGSVPTPHASWGFWEKEGLLGDLAPQLSGCFSALSWIVKITQFSRQNGSWNSTPKRSKLFYLYWLCNDSQESILTVRAVTRHKRDLQMSILSHAHYPISRVSRPSQLV